MLFLCEPWRLMGRAYCRTGEEGWRVGGRMDRLGVPTVLLVLFSTIILFFLQSA